MKEYIAKKVPYKLGIDDDKWDLVPAAELNEGWWDQFPKSYNATARLAHCDEGLILRMDAEEWPIKIKTMKVNSEVCLFMQRQATKRQGFTFDFSVRKQIPYQ